MTRNRFYEVVEAVLVEHREATSRFPSFRSRHEGYAIIKEELDELWEEIKTKNTDEARLRKEAVQLAAMALRFVVDCTT